MHATCLRSHLNPARMATARSSELRGLRGALPGEAPIASRALRFVAS
jgi:hypothetical protein